MSKVFMLSICEWRAIRGEVLQGAVCMYILLRVLTRMSSFLGSLGRRVFDNVLFPIGYGVYNSRLLGYNVIHRLQMSSAASPAAAHTHVTAADATTLGSGASSVSVRPIPILGDNYAYLLAHAASKTLALVDPASPEPIRRVLEEDIYKGYTLTHILTTHKHCQ
jgi:hypothetical protein